MAMKPGNGGGGNGERDPRLDGLYRDTPRDTPSAALDAAILAAARREVGSRPRPASTLRRWRVPVSIAAIVVLSASLVTLIREEADEAVLRDVRQPTATPAAPAAQALERVGEPAKASEDRKLTAPTPEAFALRRDEGAAKPAQRKSTVEREQKQERALSGTAPAAAPEAAAPSAAAPKPAAPPAEIASGLFSQGTESARRAEADEAKARASMGGVLIGPRGLSTDEPQAGAPQPKPMAPPSRGLEQQEPLRSKPLAEGPVVQDRARPVEQKKAAPAPAWRGLEQEPPQKWLERLAELRKRGLTREADELVAEFKKRFPDYPLPAGTE
ncbi:MAG TPA: hypothetical protein VKD25_04580 [Burkholderiales bacterium]|nr:hypothetical protein [Burkholderiales bacterium]